MKRLLILTSIISCFSVMLLSCASIITHKDTSEQTSTQLLTTPSISSVVTTQTTTMPIWSTQTGTPIVNSHSGYVMPNIYDRTLKDKNENTVVSVRILSPKVFFYDNESLQETVNANLLFVFNEIETTVNAICNRYLLADTSSYLSPPSIFVDYTLEHFTKEAMSLKFKISENDENSNTYTSFVCYNLDLITGAIINSSTVFEEGKLSAFSELVSRKLTESGYTLYDNADTIINQYFQSRWYISFNKLNLCFNPGEIAAISEGVIEISIEVQQISDLTSDYGSALFTVSYENN